MSSVKNSFLSSVFSFPTPAPTTDERESRNRRKKEKRRSNQKKEWPPAKKRYGYSCGEKTKKFIEARAANIFVIKPRTFFSLRNYVCIAKLYFHRRESCLGEIRQDDQKVRIILSRYRWIFGNTHARKIFLVSLSHFVLYFLPQ
jgi:hypothetical protein